MSLVVSNEIYANLLTTIPPETIRFLNISGGIDF